MEAETLRRLLTTPAVLSTQASLLMMTTPGDRLLGSLAAADDSTALVLANPGRAEDHLTTTTEEKEKLNGYL